MAKGNFEACLRHVLKHEGGYVNHPKDPGGATNKGITIAVFRKFVKRNGTIEDLKRITDEQVAKVYRSQYWNRVRGDDLPAGLDLAVFDFAVNSGPVRATKYLQAIIGATADGVIGPKTLEAVRAWKDARGLIKALCAARKKFLKQLSTYPIFGRGWSARVKLVETEALAMASAPASSGNEPKPVPPQPSDEHAELPPAWLPLVLVLAAAAAAVVAFILSR